MGDEKDLVFNIGPIYFDGTVLLMTVLACTIVFGLVFWASRNMQIKPKGKQNVLEWVVDFTNKIVRDNAGAGEINKFGPLAFVLFTFLLVANNIGLVTKLVTKDGISLWKSPTADPGITLGLALMVVLLSNFMGVEHFGFKKYIKNSFLTPIVTSPFNVLEEFTNFLTLGLRLYGNIFAGEILLGLLTSMGHGNPIMLGLALVLEVLWTAFSIFISCLQAYIFVTLTMVYISHKIELKD
ncbi:F0F1 ATP synthase subunit A [Streptococcaceae bacterium ESL0729]|nr:F0F1 ATP synthase subunit A [Streptococcaceae bacterium ESL0729]